MTGPARTNYPSVKSIPNRPILLYLPYRASSLWSVVSAATSARLRARASSTLAAAATGSKHVVRFLIKAGVDVDRKDDNGKTALCYATEDLHSKACRKICSMLIDAGADGKIAGWKEVHE